MAGSRSGMADRLAGTMSNASSVQHRELKHPWQHCQIACMYQQGPRAYGGCSVAHQANRRLPHTWQTGMRQTAPFDPLHRCFLSPVVPVVHPALLRTEAALCLQLKLALERIHTHEHAASDDAWNVCCLLSWLATSPCDFHTDRVNLAAVSRHHGASGTASKTECCWPSLLAINRVASSLMYVSVHVQGYMAQGAMGAAQSVPTASAVSWQDHAGSILAMQQQQQRTGNEKRSCVEMNGGSQTWREAFEVVQERSASGKFTRRPLFSSSQLTTMQREVGGGSPPAAVPVRSCNSWGFSPGNRFM